MAKSVVTDKCVKGSVNGKVRVLRKADSKPQLVIPSDGGKPSLAIIRYGNCECLPISKRVAEELLAAGFNYGS